MTLTNEIISGASSHFVRLKRPYPAHILLLGLFPLFSLFARYPLEFPVSMLVSWALWTLLSSVVISVLFVWITKDWHRATCIAGISILAFFGLGHGYAVLQRRLQTEWVITLSAVILLLWVGVFAGIWFLSGRWKRHLSVATTWLNIFAVLLVVVPFAKTARSMLINSPDFKALEVRSPHSSTSKGKPDIYYIILDAFTRHDILKQYFEEDSQPFLDSLRQLGFQIAPDSRSNYGQTQMSIASSLNMAYLDDIIPESARRANNRRALRQLLERNAVAEFLKSMGYRIICFSSGYAGTELKEFDEYIAPVIALNEIEQAYLRGTIAYPLLDLLIPRWQYWLHRHRVLFAFERLAMMPSEESPKFIFAHLVTPHRPFVFGRTGEYVTDILPLHFDEGQWYNSRAGVATYRKRYRLQLQFVQEKILETVKRILADSVTPPVIILQGDHGSGSTLNWGKPEKTNLDERMSILNALYVPPADSNKLKPTKTPVNTFRRIFNYYFGSDLPELTDNSYFSGWARPFDYLRWVPEE